MKTALIIIAIIAALLMAWTGFVTFFCEDDWCFIFPWQKHAPAEIAPQPVITDKIRVFSPLPGELIKSPIEIQGEARGFWYFEASFPIHLLDGNGKKITVVPAQAQGEWMTTEFVPFSVMLTFPVPETERGTLVLEKDNPSGLPEHDEKIEMPIRFK